MLLVVWFGLCYLLCISVNFGAPIGWLDCLVICYFLLVVVFTI